jgi:hypothetical protein
LQLENDRITIIAKSFRTFLQAYHILTANEIWRCSKMVCNSVESNLATFQLRADVVEELKAKYLERPLTFPVNFFNINRFAGIPAMA